MSVSHFSFMDRAHFSSKSALGPHKKEGTAGVFPVKTPAVPYEVYVLESYCDFLTVVVYGLGLSHEVYGELSVLLHACERALSLFDCKGA